MHVLAERVLLREMLRAGLFVGGDVEEMLRKLAKKKDQNKKLFLETKLREAEKAHSSGDFGIGGLPAVDLPE